MGYEAAERGRKGRGAGDAVKWWVLVAVGVGTFMSALDASVVNTMLPVMAGALRSAVATIEWVVTIYLLVVSALLLGVGRLGDLRGHKAIYVGGFVVFILGSALCGAAPTVAMLIAFRALQGFGAAMLFANSPAIITKTFPGSERGRALGLQGMMTYLGLTAGPSLGGWLAGTLGWRSIFYINVPVGALALVLSIHFIPSDRAHGTAARFDREGAALFTLGMVALLLALDQGHAWGWGSLPVVALLVLAALLLVAFVWREATAASPMLDLSLFRSRVFSAATTSAVLNYISLYALLFVLPFYLMRGRGMGPERAGLILTAQPLVMAVVTPVSGALSDRIGTRLPAAVGMAVLAVGLWMLAQVGAAAGAPMWEVVVALAVVGFGTGVFIAPNNSALMGAAPMHRQGIAAGILATARNVGMVLGVGIAGAVFTSVLARHGGAGAMASVGGAVPAGLFAGVRASLMVAAGVAALAAVVAMARD